MTLKVFSNQSDALNEVMRRLQRSGSVRPACHFGLISAGPTDVRPPGSFRLYQNEVVALPMLTEAEMLRAVHGSFYETNEEVSCLLVGHFVAEVPSA